MASNDLPLAPNLFLDAIMHSRDGVTIADMRAKDQPLVFVNPAFERMTGYSKDEALGKNCRYLQGHQTDQPQRARIREALDAGQSYLGVIQNYRKDGSSFWNELSLSPITDSNGVLTHYFGFQKDVSVRVQLAADLEEKIASLESARQELALQNDELKKAARLKEDVDRMTRHDMKTPLTPILMAPKLLRKSLPLDDNASKLLDTIERSGYRLLDMINRSLDLYKMETGAYSLNASALDILSLIRKITEDLGNIAQRKEVRFQIQIDGRLVTDSDTFEVLGEELLCYSMLANLMKNAVEASSHGGTVTVSLDKGEMQRIEIHNHGQVPDAIADRFFEKYSTAGKATGTGLGTYSAKLMAITQNGEIDMKSSHEKGTSVYIWLPHPDTGE